MKKNIAILLLAILLAAGCSEKQSRPKKPVLKVGTDKIEAVVLEQETQNIPYWLEEGASRRVLVRVSLLDGMMPLSEETADSLKGSAEKMDLKTLAERGDALNPDAAYSSASMVSLAKRLGLIDEVYWVVPKLQSIDEQDVEGFKNFLIERMPENKEEIDSMKLNGLVAEGTVAGIPIKMMSLQDLPVIEKPVLLQVDLSFFSDIYKDEERTRVLSLVSAFVNNLKEKNLTSDLVTISMSNAGGVPLKMRFVGRYLAELLKDPGMTEKEPPTLWSQRAYAWKMSPKSPKRAIRVYKNILKEHPRDAATRYDLAEAYFQTGEIESCKKELEVATGIDMGYIFGYSDFATRLALSGKKEQSEIFLAVARESLSGGGM